MKTFQQKVLDLVKKIPKGKVTTYKIIGKKLGKRGQIYRTASKAGKFPWISEIIAILSSAIFN